MNQAVAEDPAHLYSIWVVVMEDVVGRYNKDAPIIQMFGYTVRTASSMEMGTTCSHGSFGTEDAPQAAIVVFHHTPS
eukprot:12909893-Prorocentrum_lima.AAC.1